MPLAGPLVCLRNVPISLSTAQVPSSKASATSLQSFVPIVTSTGRITLKRRSLAFTLSNSFLLHLPSGSPLDPLLQIQQTPLAPPCILRAEDMKSNHHRGIFQFRLEAFEDNHCRPDPHRCHKALQLIEPF